MPATKAYLTVTWARSEMQNNSKNAKSSGHHQVYLRALLAAALFLQAVPASVVASSQRAIQDPTRPVAQGSTAVSQKAALQLQAVFLDEAGNRAVINGRMVRIGDSVASMRVQSIKQNKVRLINGDDVVQLQLRPNILSLPELEDQPI